MLLLVSVEIVMLTRFSIQASPGKKSHLRDSVIPSIRKTDKSLTLVAASDLSQIDRLNYVVVAWMGEISVGVCVFPKETDYYSDVIKGLYFPSRVQVNVLRTKNYAFPINELRNLAIDHASSTHVFVSDADVIPSPNLQESFLTLPNYILRDSNHALIVPLFETPFKSLPCSPWFECIEETEVYTRLSKQDLRWCLQFGGCKNLGMKDFNKFVDASWDSLPLSNYSTPLFCWDNPNQEPFLIVAKTPELPRFTPSFIDYGYNRMEWVAHLRYAGYRFSVLSQAWGFHLRHEKSFYALKSREKSDPTKGKRGGPDTAKMFEKVLRKFEAEYSDVSRIPMCSSVQPTVETRSPVKSGRKRISRYKVKR